MSSMEWNTHSASPFPRFYLPMSECAFASLLSDGPTDRQPEGRKAPPPGSAGEPFAVCVINTKDSATKYVEPVTDSSRYFVLRIEDGRGVSSRTLPDPRVLQSCSTSMVSVRVLFWTGVGVVHPAAPLPFPIPRHLSPQVDPDPLKKRPKHQGSIPPIIRAPPP